MEQLKTVNLNGLIRNNPQGTVDACDELINLRFHNNAWEPVGPKQELYPAPQTLSRVYDPVVIHKMDSNTNWIAYSQTDKKVVWYNPTTLGISQTLLTLEAGETLSAMRYLANYLIVLTDLRNYIFLFDVATGDSYTPVDLTKLDAAIFCQFSSIEQKQVVSENFTDPTADSFLGKYYKMLDDLSNDSFHVGGIFLRYVLTMYDGTQVLHSLPVYQKFASHFLKFQKLPNNNLNIICYAGKLAASAAFNPLIADIALYKDLISTIEIYASQNKQLYNVNEDTITDAMVNSVFTSPYNFDFRNKPEVGISKGFKEDMHDSLAWYKIGSINLADLELSFGTYSGQIDLDMKDFYTNYATRPVLKIDNFSHSVISGKVAYVYNSRLTLASTTQVLGKAADQYTTYMLTVPANQVTGNTTTPVTYERDGIEYLPAKIVVKVKTATGLKYCALDTTVNVYRKIVDATAKAAFLPGLLGFWDARAAEITVVVTVGGNPYKLFSAPLKPSTFGNFAYVVNESFKVDRGEGQPEFYDANFESTFVPFTYAGLKAYTYPDGINDNSVIDPNRVQPSEVNNPFVYPAENSQQVGTGTILALATNTEDVSSGQRGEYPLFVFTSEGIWGLSIGLSGVYITNVTPLSGEVLRDANSILDLSFGVAFITSEGLKIISGKDVVDISDPIEGLPGTRLMANLHLQHYVSHASLVQLSALADGVPFKTYMLGARLGFNKGSDRSEILVNNPAYPYHYVYSIENRVWSKVGGNYASFIRNYPELYAVDTVSLKVVNISKEIDGTTQVLILTRALPLDMGETFKKTRRSFVRCHLKTNPNKFAAAYLFQSDDLITWKYSTGNDHSTGEFRDIWITHSPRSSRYYAFLVVAELEVKAATNTNFIRSIEIQVDSKRDGKLR